MNAKELESRLARLVNASVEARAKWIDKTQTAFVVAVAAEQGLSPEQVDWDLLTTIWWEIYRHDWYACMSDDYSVELRADAHMRMIQGLCTGHIYKEYLRVLCTYRVL